MHESDNPHIALYSTKIEQKDHDLSVGNQDNKTKILRRVPVTSVLHVSLKWGEQILQMNQ